MKGISKKIIILGLVLVSVLSFSLVYKVFVNEKSIKERKTNNNTTFAIMIEQDDGTYVESTDNAWPSDKAFNNELSNCVDINGNKLDGILSFDSDNFVAKVKSRKTAFCYLYFDAKDTSTPPEDSPTSFGDTTVYQKVVEDYKNNKGVSLLTETSSDTYPVYYYRGNVTNDNINNNIIYADYCWKMVRTTDTGGVKLIFNGEANRYSQYNNLEKSEYNVSTNTPSGTQFTFDSSTKKWTSGIAGLNNTTNTMEFTITTPGNYVLVYDVSSRVGSDKASFYKNGTVLESNISGTARGQIDLDGLKTNDVIKVKYTKSSFSLTESGSDALSFSIGIPVGEKNIKNCDNTGTATHLDSEGTAFNSSDDSPAYVGYMYNKVYTVTARHISSDSTSYVYGNSVSWDGTQYTLVNTISGTWSSLYNDELDNYHYTCFSTSAKCASVYYIYYGKENYAHYIPLTGGININDALNEMLYAEDVNTTNSTIKTKIDGWYESNIKEKTDDNGKLYSNYLENTIYCYNRAIISLGGWNPNGGSLSTNVDFNYNTLDCENKTDQFTLKESAGGTAGYGNNTLDYPIGLLTYKEANLARNGINPNYLNSWSDYWLGSPGSFLRLDAGGSHTSSWGLYNHYDVSSTYGVRPVLSLSKSVLLKDGVGDGTASSPYEVEL